MSASSAQEQSAEIECSKQDLEAVPEGADMGLVCGNPQAIAMLVKEQGKAFIKGWFPGSGIEQFVRSADVQGVK